MSNVGLPFELHRACPPARLTPGFGSTPVETSSDNGATACCLSAPAAFAMGRCSDNAVTGCPVREIPHPPAPRAAHGRLCAPCQRRPEDTGSLLRSTDEDWRCGVRRGGSSGITPSGRSGL